MPSNVGMEHNALNRRRRTYWGSSGIMVTGHAGTVAGDKLVTAATLDADAGIAPPEGEQWRLCGSAQASQQVEEFEKRREPPKKDKKFRERRKQQEKAYGEREKKYRGKDVSGITQEAPTEERAIGRTATDYKLVEEKPLVLCGQCTQKQQRRGVKRKNQHMHKPPSDVLTEEPQCQNDSKAENVDLEQDCHRTTSSRSGNPENVDLEQDCHRTTSSRSGNPSSRYRMDESDESVIGVPRRAPQRPQCKRHGKHPLHTQTQQHKQKQKTLSPQVIFYALRKSRSTFALQRRKGGTRYVAPLSAPRRVEAGRSACVAKSDGKACFRESDKEWSPLLRQRQLTLTWKTNTASSLQRRVCQRSLRQGQRKRLGTEYNNPEPSSQDWTLRKSRQRMTERDLCETTSASSALLRSKASLKQTQPGRRKQRQASRCTQQTTPLQPNACETRYIKDVGQRQMCESTAVHTEKTGEALLNGRFGSSASETTSRTWGVDKISLGFGPLNFIEWLWLRLERVFDQDEALDTCEGLNSGGWKIMLSDFLTQYRRLKSMPACCGGPGAPPAWMESRKLRTVESNIPAGDRHESPASSLDIYYGREKGSSLQQNHDGASHIALVSAVMEEAAHCEEEQSIFRCEQAVQSNAARDDVVAMLTQQLQQIVNGDSDRALILRAAAALPRSASRGDNSGIEDQLRTLQFLGQKGNARLLRFLTRRQRSEETLSEREEEEDTPRMHGQRRQQLPRRNTHNFHQSKNSCSRRDLRLHLQLYRPGRRKLLFHDELSLLQCAFPISHLDNWASPPLRDTPDQQHTCEQRTPLEGRLLLQDSERSKNNYDGRAPWIPEDDGREGKAFTAAVACGAALAIHVALAEKGLTRPSIAGLLPLNQWLASIHLQQRATGEGQARCWWRHLTWTFYMLQGVSSRTSGVNRHEVYGRSVSRVTGCGCSTGTKSSSPVKSPQVAHMLEREQRNKLAAAAAATAFNSASPQSISSFSVRTTRRQLPPFSACRQTASVRGHLIEDHLEGVGGGSGAGRLPPGNVADCEASEGQAQPGGDASDIARGTRSEPSVMSAQTPTENTHPAGLSVLRQMPCRTRSSRRRDDLHLSPPAVDLAPPCSGWPPSDLHKRALVCRLCGRTILPGSQRTSIGAHVMHLLRRHCELIGLWVLLLDVRNLSRSSRRLFGKIVGSAVRRQQELQRSTRTPADADATDPVASVSTEKAYRKRDVSPPRALSQQRRRCEKYGMPSGMTSSAGRIQTEILHPLEYPAPDSTIANCLHRVGQALLLQRTTAGHLQQLLRCLSQQTKSSQPNTEQGLQKNSSDHALKIDRLCAKIKSTEPLSTVALLPSLWTVQMDNSLSLVISPEKQLLPNSALTLSCFPDMGKQRRASRDTKIQQHLVCWMPRDVFRYFHPDGTSVSHALLHMLLQMRDANAHGILRTDAIPPLTSILSTSQSFDSGGQITFLQSQQRSPRVPDVCSIMKGAGDTGETSGLLQAAGFCNEEFEVLDSPCSSSQYGSSVSSLLTGVSVKRRIGSQGGSSNKRMAAWPYTAGLRNRTPSNDAVEEDEAFTLTKDMMSACSPQDVPNAKGSTPTNTASSVGAASLLFPPDPSHMEAEKQTHHDGEALLRLQKPFSSAVLADTGQSTRQYLLNYVLALTSSGFMLPCILRSAFCGCHASRVYSPASNTIQKLAIKGCEASGSSFATGPAGKRNVDASSSEPLAKRICSQISALRVNAGRDFCAAPLDPANCDFSGRNTGSTTVRCLQLHSSGGHSHGISSGTSGCVSTSAAWNEFPMGRLSKTTRGLATPDAASTSIGSSLEPRRVFVTTGRFQREQLLLKNKNAEVASIKCSTLDSRKSIPAQSHSHASNACLTNLADLSPSSKRPMFCTYIRGRSVQQLRVESTAPRSRLQCAGNGGCSTARECEASVLAQSTFTSIPSGRSALQRVEQFLDSVENTQQSVNTCCTGFGCYEQGKERRKRRKLCSGGSVALHMLRHRDATARSPDSTSSDAEKLTSHQAKAPTSQANSAQVSQLSQSSSADSGGFPLDRLQPKEAGEIAGDNIELKPFLRQAPCFPPQQLTRYSWYEAFSLVPRLLRSPLSGIEIQRQHSTLTHMASYPRSFCTPVRHMCSRVSQPVEEKDVEGEVIAPAAMQHHSTRGELLRHFHLVALRPSVAVSRSEGPAYERPADDVSVGGLFSISQERGSAALSVCELMFTSSTSGEDSRDGAALDCHFSDCGPLIETMLRPISFCSASFLVTYTPASPSAEAYAGARSRRTYSCMHGSPAHDYCAPSNDHEELKAAISNAVGSPRDFIGQLVKTRHRLRGSHVKAVNGAAFCSAEKAVHSDANLNSFLALRRDSAVFTDSEVSRSSPGAFSGTVRRRRKHVSATRGVARSEIQRTVRRCVREGDSEFDTCSPLSFLSYLCSYQHGRPHACLLEIPCGGSPATAGSHSPACGCPLPPAQAAVVAAILYGQYGFLCAELATSLLTGWHLAGKQSTVREDIQQGKRKADKQNCISLCLAESSDAPSQPHVGPPADLRKGMTEYYTEKSKTVSLLLSLICHQLQCPVAAEMMSRPDFLLRLLTRASCKDCGTILGHLLCVTQLQTWLRIGTNHLLKTDGSTPESAAALASCAALESTIYNGKFNDSVLEASTGRQMTGTGRHRTSIQMMRRLAAVVLSNLLSVFYEYVQMKTEQCLLQRKQAASFEGKKDQRRQTGTRNGEERAVPPIDRVRCSAPVTHCSYQEAHYGQTGEQIPGYCGALVSQPRRKKRTESERLDLGGEVYCFSRPAEKVKSFPRRRDSFGCVGAADPGCHFVVEQMPATPEGNHLLSVEADKSGRSGCEWTTVHAKRLRPDTRLNNGDCLAEDFTCLRMKRIRRSGRKLVNLAGNAENDALVTMKDFSLPDVRGRCSTITSTRTDLCADADGVTVFATPNDVRGRSYRGRKTNTPFSLSLIQRDLRGNKRSSVDHTSREGDVPDRLLADSASRLPLFPVGMRDSEKHGLRPSTALPEMTCEACIHAKEKDDKLLSGETNNVRIEAPECALANVVVPLCPSAREECVDFGGFVRLCDDVKTGLHLQVTPYLTYIRRGAPLYIRHQLQRSGIRQSVLVDSFAVHGFTNGDMDLSSKASGRSSRRALLRTLVTVDNSDCCAQQQKSTASPAAGMSIDLSAPPACAKHYTYENSVIFRQTSQRRNTQRTLSYEPFAIVEKTSKAPCDRVLAAVNKPVHSSETGKQRLKSPGESNRRMGVAARSQTSDGIVGGKQLIDSGLKSNEATVTVTGTNSMRCTDLLQRSRIDLFAWNLLLENDIHLSLSRNSLVGKINVDRQAIDSERTQRVGCVPQRFKPRRDSPRYVEPLYRYKEIGESTFMPKKNTTHNFKLRDGSSNTDVPCDTTADAASPTPVPPPGAPMKVLHTCTAAAVESDAVSSFLRTGNASTVSVSPDCIRVYYRNDGRPYNASNPEMSVIASIDRDDDNPSASANPGASGEPTSVTLSCTPLHRTAGRTSRSVTSRVCGNKSAHLIKSTVANKVAIHPQCEVSTVASPSSSVGGFLPRRDVGRTASRLKQLLVLTDKSEEHKDALAKVTKNELQISGPHLLWDECYEEDEPPSLETRQSESLFLDDKNPADVPHATQLDDLLPTDGSSHSRLLAANWQGVDSSSLAPATQRMQEVNVSPFHGLVISEAGLLPENARLQLRRNELFFTVDQRERQARMAALLESTAIHLGVKIPSFLAHTKLLKLRRSRVHGWGVFAGEPIYRGEFIVEYSSSVISDAMANFREWQYMQSLGGKTYFFKLKNSSIVDATSSGGLTRFINHSCRPNCRTQDINSDGVDDAGAHCHLGLYALRDIAVGEELFYDYRNFKRSTRRLFVRSQSVTYFGVPFERCQGRMRRKALICKMLQNSADAIDRDSILSLYAYCLDASIFPDDPSCTSCLTVQSFTGREDEDVYACYVCTAGLFLRCTQETQKKNFTGFLYMFYTFLMVVRHVKVKKEHLSPAVVALFAGEQTCGKMISTESRRTKA